MPATTSDADVPSMTGAAHASQFASVLSRLSKPPELRIVAVLRPATSGVVHRQCRSAISNSSGRALAAVHPTHHAIANATVVTPAACGSVVSRVTIAEVSPNSAATRSRRRVADSMATA